ncbi:MAG: ABC transporter ATP-binding protein [Cellulomonadaceae bacterium]|nr:ABC transporter ATP-binding protein [Cellulomonadaceae bacterium]
MRSAAISTHGLTKRFGRVLALDALDLEVGQGEIFGFLGPNGAGKSTTIRLLLGLIRPTRGTAEVLGVPVHDVRRAHRRVGYVAGDVALWPQLTGTETLDLLGRVGGRIDLPYRTQLLERFDLDPSTRVRAYSKGNRQKVALVAAFMSRPDLLLLDEPTAGLDPLMEEEFQRLAREVVAQGQTIFLSSHILDEVEDLCDRVGILRAGTLVEVAALDDLRRLHTTVVEVLVDGPPPRLDDVPGVSDIELVEGGVRVAVTGSPAPLLQRLAGQPVTRIRTEEPTLEEIFLTYY